MIGRLLTAIELEIVFLHSERLLALGFSVDADACMADEAFSVFPPDWQALVLVDMAYLQTAPREALAHSATDATP